MVTVYEQVLPDYSIKQYTEDKYSICKFKRSPFGCYYTRSDEKQEHEDKLSQSFSRAKSMVKQYGLCNPWDWFITLTLDEKKYNRYNLDVFREDFQRWIRQTRERYKKLYGAGEGDIPRLSVLVIPENHKDGAWHMHGFVYGLPEEEISNFIPGVHPQKLIDHDFKNWSSYGEKFGFCSLGRVQDQYSAVLYALKYINKDVEALASMKGQHLYFHSRPLNKAVPVADVYGHYTDLDGFLDWHGQFCSTGFVTGKDWTFPLQYDGDMSMMDCFKPVKEEMSPDFNPAYIDPFYDDIGYQAMIF